MSNIYSVDTQVLTSSGWIKIPELKDYHRLMTYDFNTKEYVKSDNVPSFSEHETDTTITFSNVTFGLRVEVSWNTEILFYDKKTQTFAPRTINKIVNDEKAYTLTGIDYTDHSKKNHIFAFTDNPTCSADFITIAIENRDETFYRLEGEYKAIVVGTAYANAPIPTAVLGLT